jgi:hypothetical protein
MRSALPVRTSHSATFAGSAIGEAIAQSCGLKQQRPNELQPVCSDDRHAHTPSPQSHQRMKPSLPCEISVPAQPESQPPPGMGIKWTTPRVCAAHCAVQRRVAATSHVRTSPLVDPLYSVAPSAENRTLDTASTCPRSKNTGLGDARTCVLLSTPPSRWIADVELHAAVVDIACRLVVGLRQMTSPGGKGEKRRKCRR